ncbi:hypothetical protein BSLG_009041 [Batrachochytrium salamandrivorans]|nr:hypothetical protein BSLG_009041 [Batrachochytrium salamandrivorans]
MTTTTTTTPAPLKRQSLIHQHRLIKRQPQGKPPSAATTVIAPISRGGAASPSHTTSPTTATDPALPAPIVNYATYETLGRRGGPGVIEHRQEYIFQDEQDLMEATTDSEGNSAKKFATYETLGRLAGLASSNTRTV